jgi:putative transposase
MARPPRVEYAGAVYHVTARGHERGAIFRDDHDRERFLGELARRVEEERWAVHAYCLMTNHYHLLVETPEANLVAGMQRLNARYSQAFNFRHGRKGHLLEGRYKAAVVEKESYLLELCRYVVLNPVRAGMVRSAGEYRWSSYRATAGEMDPPSFLEVGWTIACFGDDRAEARKAYRLFVTEGKGAGEGPKPSADGLYVGSEAFVSRMERMADSTGRLGGERKKGRTIRRVDLEAVIAAVAEEYGTEMSTLIGAWQRGEARMVAVYLARALTGKTGQEIANAFGVSGARVSQLTGQAETSEDGELRKRIERLKERLCGTGAGV